jgi:hypothetical protein
MRNESRYCLISHFSFLQEALDFFGWEMGGISEDVDGGVVEDLECFFGSVVGEGQGAEPGGA